MPVSCAAPFMAHSHVSRRFYLQSLGSQALVDLSDCCCFRSLPGWGSWWIGSCLSGSRPRRRCRWILRSWRCCPIEGFGGCGPLTTPCLDWRWEVTRLNATPPDALALLAVQALQTRAALGHPHHPEPRRGHQGPAPLPGRPTRPIDGGGSPHDPPRGHRSQAAFSSNQARAGQSHPGPLRSVRRSGVGAS
jgi:hypothetical protein